MEQGHGAVPQQDQLAVELLPVQGEEEVLVLVQDEELLLRGHVDVALPVIVHAAGVLCLQLLVQGGGVQLRAGDLVARSVQLAAEHRVLVHLVAPPVVRVLVKVLGQVKGVGVDDLRHPEGVVLPGRHLLDVHAALGPLGQRRHLVVLQLFRLTAGQGESVEVGVVDIAGVGLAGDGVRLCGLLTLVSDEVHPILPHAAAGDVFYALNVHVQKLGHVDRAAEQLVIPALLAVLPAGRQAQEHRQGQDQGRGPSFHVFHRPILLVSMMSMEVLLCPYRRSSGAEGSVLFLFYR